VIRALAPVLVAATPAAAELELTTLQYLCDRGLVIPAAYVSDGIDSAVVTLMFDGRMFSLVGQPVEGGLRYAWPSDGSGYVWTVGGAAATLLWKDGAAGTEVALLACTQLE
jgi:membrane-bound inhibitor of C-type lysozyme